MRVFRLFAVLAAICISMSCWAWGRGHDLVARETLRLLPGAWGERLRTGEAGSLFVKSCHAPDNMKTKLSERARFLDGELRERLAAPGGKEPVLYRFHAADARCELIRAMARAIRRDDANALAYLLACFNHSVADTVSANHSPLVQLICYNWKPLGLEDDVADDCFVLSQSEEGRAILRKTDDALSLSLPDASPEAVDAAAFADELGGMDFNRYDLAIAAGGVSALEAFAKEVAFAVRRTSEALLAAEAFAALPEIPAFDAKAASVRAQSAAHAFLAARSMEDDAITHGLVLSKGTDPEIGIVYDPTGFWTRGLVYMANRSFAVQIATTLRKKRNAGLLDVRLLMRSGVPSGVKTLIVPGSGFGPDHQGFRAADLTKAISGFLSRGGRLVWVGGDPKPPASLFPESGDFVKNPVPSPFGHMRGPVAAIDMPGGALVLADGTRFVCQRPPKGSAGWYWGQLGFNYLLPDPLPKEAKSLLDFVTKDGRKSVVGYSIGSRTFLPAFALYPHVFTGERPRARPLRLELDAAGAAILEHTLGKEHEK